MFGLSASQIFVEFRRAMQVWRALYDFSLYNYIAKLYKPHGLRKRPLSKKIFASLIRRLFHHEIPRQRTAVRLRETLEQLGPTYVKLGQILSLRDDMLPFEITRELRKLQKKVPPFSFEKVKRTIEADFDLPLNQIFKSFEKEPIASASLAQAHVAYLHDGSKVAVKVQRPGILKLILQDLNILRRLGNILEVLPISRDYRPKNLIKEFSEYTIRELDFIQEGKHADIFRENFADEPKLIVPEIYWNLTSRRVLTMQFIDGVEPDDHNKMKQLGINGKALAQLGTKFVIKMLYVDGFFHGDPHPGNLLVVDKDKFALLDMGMIGVFSKKTMRYLFLYYYFLVLGEYDTAVKHLLKLCTPSRSSDIKGFKREITQMARDWQGADFMNFSLGKFILQSMNNGAKYKLYFNSDLMLGMKAVITIEAVGHILYPKMNLAEVSEPIMTEVFLKMFSPEEIIKPMMNVLPDYIEAIMKMPEELLKTAQLISKGEFKIELDEDYDDEEPGLRKYALQVAVVFLGLGAYLSLSDNHFEAAFTEELPLIWGMPVLALMSFCSATLLFLSSLFSRKYK